jgi:hypothetical protein
MEEKELFYFVVKVKTDVPDDSTGKVKSKTFEFAYKTLSFSDAEYRASEEMIELGWDQHDIFAIARTKIAEHHEFADKDPDQNYAYFKFKIEFEMEDDKKTSSEILVEEKGLTEAKKFTEELLKDSEYSWKISKVEETKIISVKI